MKTEGGDGQTYKEEQEEYASPEDEIWSCIFRLFSGSYKLNSNKKQEANLGRLTFQFPCLKFMMTFPGLRIGKVNQHEAADL